MHDEVCSLALSDAGATTRLNRFRDLPSVDRLLTVLTDACDQYGHDTVRDAARDVVSQLRAQLQAGESPTLTLDVVAANVHARLEAGRVAGKIVLTVD